MEKLLQSDGGEALQLFKMAVHCGIFLSLHIQFWELYQIKFQLEIFFRNNSVNENRNFVM